MACIERDIRPDIDIVNIVKTLKPDSYVFVLSKGAYKKVRQKCEKLYYILMTKIPTYSMDLYNVLLNDSCMPHAALVHRMAMCPVRQAGLMEENKVVPMRISFQGPGYVMTAWL